MQNQDEIIYFNYFFRFDHSEEQFSITLNLNDLRIINVDNTNKPKWTRLEYKKCSNCKLKENEHPYCPVALNFSDIIPSFRNYVSYDRVYVRVETADRNYEKDTTVQQGLSSLLGIIMVTSGCPTMQILRPMVRFHLPFATIEETIFRSASSYLLAQYFRLKNGEKPDWNMENLLKGYEEIQLVNVGITNRLRNISKMDANTNAVIVLDVFAKEMPYSIFEGLKNLQYLYEDFLNKR